MKVSFAFVFALAVLAVANAESAEERVRRIHFECLEADAITPHLLCMNIKLGVMKANGDIDKDGLRALLSEAPLINSTVVDDVLANCSERNGSTAAEVAEALKECMKKRSLVLSPKSVV